jgi:hypothetical protein
VAGSLDPAPDRCAWCGACSVDEVETHRRTRPILTERAERHVTPNLNSAELASTIEEVSMPPVQASAGSGSKGGLRFWLIGGSVLPMAVAAEFGRAQF